MDRARASAAAQEAAALSRIRRPVRSAKRGADARSPRHVPAQGPSGLRRACASRGRDPREDATGRGPLVARKRAARRKARAPFPVCDRLLRTRAVNRAPARRIILLNGASSSGKSTLARGLQAALDEPFWNLSIDHLNAAGVLPKARIKSGEFPWPRLRPQFFDGFHRCLPVLAEAGNNLIVEHIVETAAWMQSLWASSAISTCSSSVFTVPCRSSSGGKGSVATGGRRREADYETTHDFAPMTSRSTAPALSITTSMRSRRPGAIGAVPAPSSRWRSD